LPACCTGVIQNFVWHCPTYILTALLLQSMAQHTIRGASKTTAHAEYCPASALTENSTLASISTCPVDFHVAADTNVFRKSWYMPFLIAAKCLSMSSCMCVCMCRLKPCSKGQMQRAQLLPRATLMLCRAPTLAPSMRPMSQRCKISLMKPARGIVVTHQMPVRVGMLICMALEQIQMTPGMHAGHCGM